jgi:hypothetical protein
VVGQAESPAHTARDAAGALDRKATVPLVALGPAHLAGSHNVDMKDATV